MKKYSVFAMLAVAAMAAFSCAKEVEITNEPEKEFTPKVITAYTDEDVTADTKTSLNGVSVVWASTDNIKGYDGADVHTSTATAISDGGKKATFTFATVDIENDLYYVAYPAENVSDIDDDFVYATIPSTQVATAGSFANGANIAVADGMTAEPLFKNVGGLLSITINNDDITSVKLSANESLTGESKISMAAATFAEATITSGSKSVTLSGTIANGSEYYAVVYPGSFTGLKIEVTNSSGQVATYTNPNTLTVGRNANLHIATLTIPSGKWETPTKGSEYVWTLASGDLGTNGNPSADISDKGSPATDWSASYTFADDTKYIGWSSDRGVQFGSGSHACTGATFSTTGYSGYIQNIAVNATATGEGNIAVSVGGVSLKYSSSTSQALTNSATEYLFEADELIKGTVEVIYTDGTKAFYLKSIKINPDTRTPQTLSFPQSAYSAELTDGTYASPALSGAQTPVTYDSSDKTVAEVDNTGLVTLKAIGSTVITATAAENDTYQEGTASYTLTVTAGPQSIASVIAASSGASVYTQGIVAQVNLKGFIITDGTDNLFVYQNATPQVVVGQSVKVTGTRGAYNNVPQISSPTITAGAIGQTVTRTTLSPITSSNATGFTSSQYVSLTGTLSVNGSYFNVSIDGSTVQGSIYQTSDTQTFTGGTITEMDGKVVVVTGYVTGSAAKYLYIAPVDIVVDPTVATLVTDPVDGTTIEWDADKFGSSNEETIIVNINSAASGYSVDFTDANDEWNVSDNTTGSITVSPKAANTSSTANKELEITITHKDETTLTSVITLKQKRAGGKTYTITWNATNNSGAVNNYTSSWSVTADGLTLDMVNWNNNQNGWNYVRCGRKANNSGTEYPSVATIIGTVPEAIKTIKITIDAINASYVNSATLYIASDETFTNPQTVSIPQSTGEQILSVPTPAVNQYYKIEFDCASMPKSGSNGFVQISQLVFTTE